jgi:hypothetical protein
MLMIPHGLDNRLPDGGEDVSLNAPAVLCSPETFSSDHMDTRTRDLPACSIVPQATTLPRGPSKRG